MIGTARVGASLNLDGRQSQWKDQLGYWDGPSLRLRMDWNCIHVREGFTYPRTDSCSGGVGTFARTYYATDTAFAAQNNYSNHSDDYYYKYEYKWEATGYSGTWVTKTLASNRFHCSGNTCIFKQ